MFQYIIYYRILRPHVLLYTPEKLHFASQLGKCQAAPLRFHQPGTICSSAHPQRRKHDISPTSLHLLATHTTQVGPWHTNYRRECNFLSQTAKLANNDNEGNWLSECFNLERGGLTWRGCSAMICCFRENPAFYPKLHIRGWVFTPYFTEIVNSAGWTAGKSSTPRKHFYLKQHHNWDKCNEWSNTRA